jgi:hypothetical protein
MTAFTIIGLLLLAGVLGYAMGRYHSIRAAGRIMAEDYARRILSDKC